jgi:hypothetical protein
VTLLCFPSELLGSIAAELYSAEIASAVNLSCTRLVTVPFANDETRRHVFTQVLRQIDDRDQFGKRILVEVSRMRPLKSRT